jgi:cytochrome c-type biogenesis protein CcmE
MNPIRIKLLIAAGIIGIAVAMLAFAGVREGWVYYLPVDDFVENEDRHDARVRLHGIVATDDLSLDSVALEASFNLEGDRHVLPVSYRGIIPDTFQAEREVVVEGSMDESGVFQADVLLTKCASRYEGEGDAPHADPRAKVQP